MCWTYVYHILDNLFYNLWLVRVLQNVIKLIKNSHVVKHFELANSSDKLIATVDKINPKLNYQAHLYQMNIILTDSILYTL